jgi:hypothetical protein
MALFGAAMLLNRFADPWGTYVIVWPNALLGVVFVVAIIWEIRRGWSAQPPQFPESSD